MAQFQPPTTVEDLIRLIQIRNVDGLKSYRTLATFLSRHAQEAAVLPVRSIAEICRVHPSSLARYAQTLGYRNFKEMRAVFQRRS